MIDTSRDWLLISDKLSRWGALSSPSITAGDMPLSYLISSQQPTDRCRFIGPLDEIEFTIDLTEAMAAQGVSTWRSIALTYNNSSSTGFWFVIGNSTYNTGIVTVTHPLWPSPDCKSFKRIHSYIYEPLGVTDPILTIYIRDITPRKPALNASGFDVADYFEIGNLIVDFGIRSDVDNVVRLGGTVSEGLDEESKIITSEGGPVFPRIRPRAARKSFSLKFRNKQSYRTGMAQLRRDVGVSQAVMLIEDLNGDEFQMDGITYGLMDGLQDVSLADDETFEVIVKIKEML